MFTLRLGKSIKPIISLNNCKNMRKLSEGLFSTKPKLLENQHYINRSIRRTSNISMPVYQQPTVSRNTMMMAGGVVLTGGCCAYLYYNVKPTSDMQNITFQQYADKLVRETYGYVLGGLGLTATSAMVLFKTKFPERLLRMNPWAFLGVNLAVSIPMLLITMGTNINDSPIQKHVAWAGFNVAMSGGLCTIGFLGGPLIAQAALITGCIVGGLSIAGTSINRSDPNSLAKYETPLGIGLGVIVAAGLGSMMFPIPILYGITLYGGLAVFAGLTMTDTNKMLVNAKKSIEQKTIERTYFKGTYDEVTKYRTVYSSPAYDPINESLGLYFDTLNIFIRVAQILSNTQSKAK